jgi:putative toxin-antitoxin system antitoxin component (TIGR02293 family)
VIAFAEVSDLLGMIKPKGAIESPLQFVDLIEKGLPLKALDRIATRIAPSDATFKYRIVPKATLARYTVRLNATQSTRVARLAGVWALARKVWRSDEEARDFLFRPHQLLEGRRPIDVAIENELGGELVRDTLGRLEYGSAV